MAYSYNDVKNSVEIIIEHTLGINGDISLDTKYQKYCSLLLQCPVFQIDPSVGDRQQKFPSNLPTPTPPSIM